MKYILQFVFILIFFTHCTSIYKSPYSLSNRFVDGIYSAYYNDSLKISIDYFGDYHPLVSSSDRKSKSFLIRKADFNLYRKSVLKKYPYIDLKQNNFVFYVTSDVEPCMHSAMFYVSPVRELLDTVFYDISKGIVSYYKKLDEGAFIFTFNLNKKYKLQDANDILKKESLGIHATLLVGKSYKKTNPENPFDVVNIDDSANYMNAITSLELIKNNYATTVEKEMWLQAALTYNSFISNNLLSNKYLSEYYHPTDSTTHCTIFDEEAIRYIENQIHGQQIVIMNEQHWQPKHRFIGDLLLKNLYDEGFRYLAVEALSDEDEYQLNERKYPVQASGLYTKEPAFGNFIRNALKMGFKLISYDSFDTDREYRQANTIYQKILKNTPQAKVFVWCGIGHVLEDKRQYPMMAYYLKEKSGIDPLTIEQTQGDVRSKFIGTHYLAIDTLKRKGADIYLYNNIKEQHFNIIPHAEQKAIKIALSKWITQKVEQHGHILLMVYDRKEFEENHFSAVPMLNYLLNENIQPTIYLPKGEYTLIKRSPTGIILEEDNLLIN